MLDELGERSRPGVQAREAVRAPEQAQPRLEVPGVGLGGLPATSSSPRAGASISTREQVERARDLVGDLATRSLEPILDRLEPASEAVGMPVPASVVAWSERLSWWIAVRDTLACFDAELYAGSPRGDAAVAAYGGEGG